MPSISGRGAALSESTRCHATQNRRRAVQGLVVGCVADVLASRAATSVSRRPAVAAGAGAKRQINRLRDKVRRDKVSLSLSLSDARIASEVADGSRFDGQSEHSAETVLFGGGNNAHGSHGPSG